MNYNETIDFLYHQLPVFQREGKAAYKANLDNTHALDVHFGYPHRFYKTIHVAGTNGKGSVSHMLSSVLQSAGYKVGLYTSPHLLDMRERIKVNGQMCSEQFVVDFVAENMSVINRIKPSFFELMVLMAFRYFQEQKVDVAVVEVGMGGRLDSTNIITPLLSIITNIGLDHTQFLGTTVQQIAGEKGGIIKPDVPVVIGEKNALTAPVFEEFARKANSSLRFSDQEFLWQQSTVTKGKQDIYFSRHGNKVKYSIDLLGTYQRNNLASALVAIGVLKNRLEITHDDVQSGLANIVKSTGLMGRWQVLRNAPITICDTGHNKEGLQYVVEQLKSLQADNLHLVLGLVKEKNPVEILAQFPPNASFYLTKAAIPRAMETKVLRMAAAELNLNFKVFENVNDAVLCAQKNANEQDAVFIGGSTFVVAEAISFLNLK